MKKKDESSIDNYGNIFPSQTDADARTNFVDFLYQPMIIDLSVTTLKMIEQVQISIADGKIDQKFLYMDPISVKKWQDLISAEKYSTYNHCSSALNSFLESDVWENIVSQKKLRNIIDLGVGAGQKDYRILDSYLKKSPSTPVQFVLIDTSFPMLEQTLSELREFVSRHDTSVGVLAVRADFLHLKRVVKLWDDKSNSDKEGTKNAYFILGCTFSNVSEIDFLKSITESTSEGDVLVIAAETYTEANQKSVEIEMMDIYDHEDLYELIMIPIKNYLDNKQLCLSNGIHAKISSKESSVPGALTITMGTELTGKELIVANSSRYIKDKLVEYVNSFGWKYLDSHYSKTNDRYVYLSFEREGED